jgi:hypothetical protein
VNFRLTRSLWTGGPGFLVFGFFFAVADHHPPLEQIRHAVRSHML